MVTDYPEVEFDDDNFRLVREGGVLHEVLWSEIQEIYAFKRDLLIVDEICLGFRIDDSGRFTEVSEEWPGYKLFVQFVEQHFPLKDDWWREVAFPAFETNMMTIWKRSVASES